MLRGIWGDPERYRGARTGAEFAGHLLHRRRRAPRRGRLLLDHGPRRRRDERRRPPPRHDGGRERAGLAPRRSPRPRSSAGPTTSRARRSCAFVTLEGGTAHPTPTLATELSEHVAKEIGAIARPDDIRFTDALPKTRSGKIMRRLLRDIAAGTRDRRRHDDARGLQRAREAAGERRGLSPGLGARAMGRRRGREASSRTSNASWRRSSAAIPASPSSCRPCARSRATCYRSSRIEHDYRDAGILERLAEPDRAIRSASRGSTTRAASDESRVQDPVERRDRRLQGRPPLPSERQSVDPEIPRLRADLQERADDPADGGREGRRGLRSPRQERRRGHALLPGLHVRALPPHRPEYRRARRRHRRRRPRGRLPLRPVPTPRERVHGHADRQGPRLRRLPRPHRGDGLRLRLLRPRDARDPRRRDPRARPVSSRARATSRNTRPRSSSSSARGSSRSRTPTGFIHDPARPRRREARLDDRSEDPATRAHPRVRREMGRDLPSGQAPLARALRSRLSLCDPERDRRGRRPAARRERLPPRRRGREHAVDVEATEHLPRSAAVVRTREGGQRRRRRGERPRAGQNAMRCRGRGRRSTGACSRSCGASTRAASSSDARARS